MNETVDNANASTNQSNQHKAKNQLVVSNRTDKRSDPRDGACDPATDIGKHSRDGISGRSSLKNHTFQKLFYIH